MAITYQLWCKLPGVDGIDARLLLSTTDESEVAKTARRLWPSMVSLPSALVSHNGVGDVKRVLWLWPDLEAYEQDMLDMVPRAIVTLNRSCALVTADGSELEQVFSQDLWTTGELRAAIADMLRRWGGGAVN
jgi:predicted RNA polymerase sigma factor